MENPDSTRRDGAESLAIQALTFLAGEPERLARFLALTGIGPAQIRAAAATPGFLAGVLDHIASEDALVTAFAAQSGLVQLRMLEELRDAGILTPEEFAAKRVLVVL